MMNCPSCKTGTLTPNALKTSTEEKGASASKALTAKKCTHCDGVWILMVDYLSWKTSESSNIESNATLNIELEDTKKALICPVSGTLMTKYQISHNSTHKLDYSIAANGIWLDKGEWELIINEGLADQLNQICTHPWQNNIKKEIEKSTLESRYTNLFGQDDFAKIKEARTWINSHPEKHQLIAFLCDSDPFEL